MVQCGMGRCGMNSADPREADEKLITEDEIVSVPKVPPPWSLPYAKFIHTASSDRWLQGCWLLTDWLRLSVCRSRNPCAA